MSTKFETLWKNQKGLCALTGLPMALEEEGLNVAVLDGNQLLCRWVADAKGDAPDDEFKRLLVLMRSANYLEIDAKERPEPGDPTDALFMIIMGHFVKVWWRAPLILRVGGDGLDVHFRYQSVTLALKMIDGTVFAQEQLSGLNVTTKSDRLDRFECELANPDSVDRLLAYMDKWVETRLVRK